MSHRAPACPPPGTCAPAFPPRREYRIPLGVAEFRASPEASNVLMDSDDRTAAVSLRRQSATWAMWRRSVGEGEAKILTSASSRPLSRPASHPSPRKDPTLIVGRDLGPAFGLSLRALIILIVTRREARCSFTLPVTFHPILPSPVLSTGGREGRSWALCRPYLPRKDGSVLRGLGLLTAQSFHHLPLTFLRKVRRQRGPQTHGRNHA